MIRRLAASTAVTASLLGATVTLAPAATAAGTPTQVALVVQYPDGSVQTSCVAYASGMTGADVLQAQRPTYGAGPYQGFVLRINGQGNTQDTPPTDSTYWAYWRSTGGTAYSYSGAGVTSTRPTAGSVEAWVWYENGETSFPKASYASLCPAGYAAPATPAAPSGAGGAGGGAASSGDAGTSASAAATGPRPTTTSGGSATPAGTSSAAAPTGAATPTVTGTAPTSQTTTSTSPGRTTSVAASDVASSTDTGVGAGQTVGLLIAGVAVLGLGGTALVIRRRRTEAD